MIKLTCLYNADGEVVGWFSDYVVEMAARREWDAYYDGIFALTARWTAARCRSKETTIVAAELENVEPGDGDRVDMICEISRNAKALADSGAIADMRILRWQEWGAVSVEIQRFLINKYRRPGISARDNDLGGPTDAAGVLYVLKIKAPR